jgi:hypothetical protein
MYANLSTGSGICLSPHERLFLKLPAVYIFSRVGSQISSLCFVHPASTFHLSGT